MHRTQAILTEERARKRPLSERVLLAGLAVTGALLSSTKTQADFWVNYDIPNRTGQTADALSVLMNSTPTGVPVAQNTGFQIRKHLREMDRQ